MAGCAGFFEGSGFLGVLGVFRVPGGPPFGGRTALDELGSRASRASLEAFTGASTCTLGECAQLIETNVGTWRKARQRAAEKLSVKTIWKRKDTTVLTLVRGERDSVQAQRKR